MELQAGLAPLNERSKVRYHKWRHTFDVALELLRVGRDEGEGGMGRTG